MGVKFQILLTLKIDVNWGSASSFSAFTSKENVPQYPLVKKLVKSRVGPYMMTKEFQVRNHTPVYQPIVNRFSH
jgi:hypothetical protein